MWLTHSWSSGDESYWVWCHLKGHDKDFKIRWPNSNMSTVWTTVSICIWALCLLWCVCVVCVSLCMVYLGPQHSCWQANWSFRPEPGSPPALFVAALCLGPVVLSHIAGLSVPVKLPWFSQLIPMRPCCFSISLVSRFAFFFFFTCHVSGLRDAPKKSRGSAARYNMYCC